MRIIHILATVCLTAVILTACTDYAESKLKEMDPSTVSLDHATGVIEGCSLSGTITDIIDCYLTVTAFDGKTTTIKINDVSTNSEMYQSAATSGQLTTKITLRVSDQFNTLKNNNQLRSSYDYAFKPGKLTGMLYVRKTSGVDSTYTYTCANNEKAGTLVGDSINGAPGPVTEANIKAWMKSIYDSGVYASFYYLVNEQGWPVCFTRNDDVPVYDFE